MLLSIALTLVAIILLFYGVKEIKNTWGLMQNSTYTQAIVTNVRVSHRDQRDDGSWRKTIYYPTFSFEDEQGISYTKIAQIGSNLKIQKGQSVDVLYDPKDPQETVRRNSMLWLPGILFTLAGIIIQLFAILLLVAKRKADSLSQTNLASQSPPHR